MKPESIRRSLAGLTFALALLALSACATAPAAPYSRGDGKCASVDWNRCVYLF